MGQRNKTIQAFTDNLLQAGHSEFANTEILPDRNVMSIQPFSSMDLTINICLLVRVSIEVLIARTDSNYLPT